MVEHFVISFISLLQ